MSERDERVGVNEAFFREVNERLETINESFGVGSELLVLVCECADPTCIERFEMMLDDYEQLRADPTTFAVVPGHEDGGSEDVVVQREDYTVVRKREEAGDAAESLDPRS